MAAKKSVSLRKSTPKAASPDVRTSGRVTVSHGAFLIVAGSQNDVCAAVGYLGTKRVEAATGETVDAAVASVQRALDQHRESMRATRVGAVPTEAEYGEAFDALYPKLSKRMKAMLATHCRQPNGAATLFDLARRFDVVENTAAQDYGKLARGLADLLAYAPTDPDLDRKLLPLLSLAEMTTAKQSGRTILRLRPELIGALRTRQQIQA